jgi:Na+-translocating ferredoxin:NAD+ oxidoreductase RnfC subunit
MTNSTAGLIRECGVVGAGGAGFPTHVKLSSEAQFVIMNAAECEPLLQVDQRLLAEYAEDILFALQMVVAAVKARKGIVSIKGKHRDVIACIESALLRYPELELFELGDFYPAGDEQVTVYEVLKKIVPEGGIPLHVQAVVLNVETLFNVRNAIQNVPVTEKFLTVIGEVYNPVTVKVPIGISVPEAIALAGGPSIAEYSVIEGGPMMGKLIDVNNAVVSKTTKGYIVLPSDHPLVLSKGKSMERMLRDARIACCHCSICTEVCPRNLLGHRIHPDKLMRMASYRNGIETDPKMDAALLCSECGLCEYACVMGLQPWKLNSYLKEKFAEAGIKRKDNRQPESVSEFRGNKKFPIKRLMNQLKIGHYDAHAPLITANEDGFTRVFIGLKQHFGAAALPVVSTGDRVEKGELIADIPEGRLGARIHASIAGEVANAGPDLIEIVREGQHEKVHRHP